MTFAPGRSGNPGGRPKEKPWRDALMLALKDGDGLRLRRIADAVAKAAEGGDLQAAKEIGDRLDGKVPQGIIGGDEDDPPVKVSRVEIVAADVDSKNNSSA